MQERGLKKTVKKTCLQCKRAGEGGGGRDLPKGQRKSEIRTNTETEKKRGKDLAEGKGEARLRVRMRKGTKRPRGGEKLGHWRRREETHAKKGRTAKK